MDLLGYHLPSLVGVGTTFAAVYGAFAKFDKDQSDENRKFVRGWLLGLDVNEQNWRHFFVELFAKFFGSRHLSLKCIRRSSMLSIPIICLIWIIDMIRSPTFFYDIIDPDIRYFALASPILGSITDYLSLWKTRILLTKVDLPTNAFLAMAVVAGDAITTVLIWFALFVGVAHLFDYFHGEPITLQQELKDAFSVLSDSDPLPKLLLLAALLTSAWLWVYFTVSYLMRGITLMLGSLRPLSRIMDFEDHPVRTIGYVAATVSAVIVGTITLLWDYA